MKRIRGFKLKLHRVSTLFRFILHGQNRSRFRYRRVNSPTTCKKPISNLFSCIKSKAKSLCFPGRGGYLRLGGNNPVVPKGQMVVYVGQKDGFSQRVLVPVVYFNHPLFGDLLREAEEEFGFTHPGGNITLPCRISDFQRVQTRIAAAGTGSRRFLTWMKAS